MPVPLLNWQECIEESQESLFQRLETSAAGLSTIEATARLSRSGTRSEQASQWLLGLKLFLSQFQSPITMILIAAATLSLFLQDVADALIILAIVLIGALLGFWHEFSAANVLRTLLGLIQSQVQVLRDGRAIELATDQIVPGDILNLSAGSTIPADCRLLVSQDLFVNESALTGESFPVEKRPETDSQATTLLQRQNLLFQGTHVISGTAQALVLFTGKQTQLGQISHRLRLRAPETDFEQGVRRFGYFLMQVTLLLLLGIFAIHIALRNPALDTLLFSLAIAVGLTPQLLPAVISVNLAQGARELGKCKVIVRRLSSIENFGSMNVLCSDKTGTLTEGSVRVERCIDYTGATHERALLYAGINASLETGFSNPIDETLRKHVPINHLSVEKLDEIPYDFLRRRLSVLAKLDGRRILIVKGAIANVLGACNRAESASGESVAIEQVRSEIDRQFQTICEQGYRVIAVAYRDINHDRVSREDEQGLILAGLLVLSDPPRQGIGETVDKLARMGVALKIITGDNRVVAASVAQQVGLDGTALLTGSELAAMTDEALMQRARDTKVFAEIEPNQKERIVVAIKRSGSVVGYIGDGINDATALHAADVGISVDGAVDVAKQAADIVLLEHDLSVLMDGVRQGRATFANTLKYIFVATSANFGNMFSMAGLSLFLPYLPLLPKQILLTNLLTDIPEMTIARDSVDQELVEQPQRWNIEAIRGFMIVFGLLSSIFDYATFAVLLWGMRADENQFRTGWFLESVVSACAVVLIVRSRHPLWSNRPANLLILSTAIVIAIAIYLPYSGFSKSLGFVPLPASTLAVLAILVFLYAASAEFLKRWYYTRHSTVRSSGQPK